MRDGLSSWKEIMVQRMLSGKKSLLQPGIPIAVNDSIKLFLPRAHRTGIKIISLIVLYI